jgi:hypothetical protein
VTPSQKRLLGACGAVLVGTSLLKRSRLVRLAVAGTVAAAAYTRLTGREPEWHDVEPPR